MDKAPFPYQFIAIEGNIGTGKTTLCEGMQARFGCNLVLEQFTDNPFLPVFYKNPERYAFPVELFFMTERHKQLQAHFAEPDLFSTFTVSDYFFLKTLLFAKKNLNDEEYRLFQRLFQVLNAPFPKPELLVYLHRPIEVLVKQIEKRGRSMEDYITPAYLENIQSAYFDFFKTNPAFPVLVIDMGDLDFVQEPALLDKLYETMGQRHSAGVTQIAL